MTCSKQLPTVWYYPYDSTYPQQAPLSAFYNPVAQPLSQGTNSNSTAHRLGAASNCFQGAIQHVTRWLGGAMWGNLQLVASQRCTVITVYLYLHCTLVQCNNTNGEYPTECYTVNWHTVHTEGNWNTVSVKGWFGWSCSILKNLL